MILILLCLAICTVAGIGAWLTRRSPKLTSALGQGGAVSGAALGMVGAISVMASGIPEGLRCSWSVPFGSCSIELDALSAFFLLPVFLLTGLAAVYGARYLSQPKYASRLGSHWLFFNLLSASMVVVIVARNAILFLMAWEIMALASFFLVTLEHERESVQRAGWIYLISTHLGTAVLFFFFILLGSKSGSLDFDSFQSAGEVIGPQATLLFILALIGFGTKAGIVPVHVWLPEAHPAAPSHISALMSGVMIKTGIYGIVRTLIWLDNPSVEWALTLIGIGGVSGVLGVLLALAQHDLKRLLAYHSVENIGIIFLGLGVGVLGQATGTPILTVLGYGGGLLHVLNHSIFKALLFLGAGNVLHGAHTLNLENTGGLLKRMPWTGTMFLVGAVAICGLPPLNGFVSEFMIYAGAFHAVQSLDAFAAIPSILAILALALIGGLAVACFTKAFGIIFLGQPRSQHASEAHESAAAMRWPMVVLAALCVLIGILAPLSPVMLRPVILQVAPLAALLVSDSMAQIQTTLAVIVGVMLLCALLAALLLWRRRTKLTGRARADAVTWDCGYAAPTARMQYTAASFAQPILRLVAGIVRLPKRFTQPKGYFPSAGSFSTETPDVVEREAWAPAFRIVERVLMRFRWIQTGSIHLYILYMAITLIVLLIWKLW
ncbi:MAG: proton-conducting transporter membrane subunit [bacterium]|nr:proton-conducting transporter membrane subunit [bacterium]